MSHPCPELIFVSGPQQGQRAVLIKRRMVAGRLPSCDIVLTEESISRQQMAFEITPEGWVVENLSDRGTRINGKKYKGKQILLDTGDVLGVGAATEILFVGPDDNPDEAQAEYRRLHPAVETPAAILSPLSSDQAHPQPVAEEPSAPLAVSVRPASLHLATPEESMSGKGKVPGKMRKYLIVGAVYVGIMVALVVFLSTLKKKPPQGRDLPWIDNETIARSLREDIVRRSNADLAAERLNDAVIAYDNRNFRRGNLQKCVKNFMLALAYSERKSDFADPAVSEKYQIARDELISKVQNLYQSIWPLEKDNRWAVAVRLWEELYTDLPSDPEWDTPGYKALTNNIMDHSSYARRNLPKK